MFGMMDSGDCGTIGMYLKSLNFVLKRVKIGSLCFVYFTTIKKKIFALVVLRSAILDMFLGISCM